MIAFNKLSLIPRRPPRPFFPITPHAAKRALAFPYYKFAGTKVHLCVCCIKIFLPPLLQGWFKCRRGLQIASFIRRCGFQLDSLLIDIIPADINLHARFSYTLSLCLMMRSAPYCFNYTTTSIYTLC
jgi:hypothetical protein